MDHNTVDFDQSITTLKGIFPHHAEEYLTSI